MTGRTCATCHEPFDRDRPPVEPVKLREGQPGATVPRLQITMLGSLCGACARARIAVRRRK
jgi:hypothetical protein